MKFLAFWHGTWQHAISSVLRAPYYSANRNPADRDSGRRQSGVECYVRGSLVDRVAQAQDASGRCRGLSYSRDGSVRLVLAGFGVADRGDHSMINSDLDRL